MLRTGLGLCFLIGCWAVADADKCEINANGTSTCAGSDQTTLLQSRVQVSIDDTDSLSPEAPTESPTEAVTEAPTEAPTGATGEEDDNDHDDDNDDSDDAPEQPSNDMRAKAEALREKVFSCLKDRLASTNDTQAADAKYAKDRHASPDEDTQAAHEKYAKLQKVGVAELYKLMQQRGIPLTALPDEPPFTHDADVADASILVGQEAAADIVHEEFDTAVHHFEDPSMEVTKAGLGKLAERIAVLLEMCGDKEEALLMSNKIKAISKKQGLNDPDVKQVLEIAAYVSNTCQLDSLDIAYFVGSAGPGELRARTHCNSLITNSMVSVREKNRMRLEVHTTGDTEKSHVLSGSRTDREAYCDVYFDFVAGEPSHWISGSTDLKAYVDCFCTRRQPEGLCRQEHASELATIQSQVEDILKELPDPSTITQPSQDAMQGALLGTMSNDETGSIPFGPCKVPVECEFCFIDDCISTKTQSHRRRRGKKVKKVKADATLFESLQALFKDPDKLDISGQCTACVALKPEPLFQFKLTLGFQTGSGLGNLMARFSIIATMTVCVGGKLKPTAKKFGIDCFVLGTVEWHPFINKVKITFYVPIPLPFITATLSSNLVLGDLSDPYKTMCENKGWRSRAHFECLRNGYEARGEGFVAFRIDLYPPWPLRHSVPYNGYWPSGSYNFDSLAVQQSGYLPGGVSWIDKGNNRAARWPGGSLTRHWGYYGSLVECKIQCVTDHGTACRGVEYHWGIECRTFYNDFEDYYYAGGWEVSYKAR